MININPQYITDHNGETTGVFIPIVEWNELKRRYTNIEHDEEVNIPNWQMNEIRKRLEDYKNKSEKALDFDAALDDIEKSS